MLACCTGREGGTLPILQTDGDLEKAGALTWRPVAISVAATTGWLLGCSAARLMDCSVEPESTAAGRSFSSRNKWRQRPKDKTAVPLRLQLLNLLLLIDTLCSIGHGKVPPRCAWMLNNMMRRRAALPVLLLTLTALGLTLGASNGVPTRHDELMLDGEDLIGREEGDHGDSMSADLPEGINQESRSNSSKAHLDASLEALHDRVVKVAAKIGDERRPLCAGYLIRDQWVLTAASCVHTFTADPNSVESRNLPYVVQVPDVQNRSKLNDLAIAQSFCHPFYDFIARSADLCLLLLNEPVLHFSTDTGSERTTVNTLFELASAQLDDIVAFLTLETTPNGLVRRAAGAEHCSEYSNVTQSVSLTADAGLFVHMKSQACVDEMLGKDDIYVYSAQRLTGSAGFVVRDAEVPLLSHVWSFANASSEVGAAVATDVGFFRDWIAVTLLSSANDSSLCFDAQEKAGRIGDVCDLNAECCSGVCLGGACQAATCGDLMSRDLGCPCDSAKNCGSGFCGAQGTCEVCNAETQSDWLYSNLCDADDNLLWSIVFQSSNGDSVTRSLPYPVVKGPIAHNATARRVPICRDGRYRFAQSSTVATESSFLLMNLQTSCSRSDVLAPFTTVYEFNLRDDVMCTKPVYSPLECTAEDVPQETNRPQYSSSALPTESPTPTSDGEAELPGSCFPAAATVLLVDGTVRAMEHLMIGDRVLTGNPKQPVSDIYLFGHRTQVGMFDFLELGTSNGRSLTLSPGHYVHTMRRGVQQARYIRKGDELVDTDGQAAAVESILQTRQRGLYNPHTMQGDLLVNGFRASSYTHAVPPGLAHVMLGPVRVLYSISHAQLFSCIEKGLEWMLRSVSNI
ncbi:Protein hedgehog [Porphyridium purpureum]|uniref:Protein hedgehog n=1 Tax=Porphyridium purpureum TaxID=35688 RepID=A0A5J4Z846_PORPP|nr:Protein hedgehog [Porphyridium purpureum]|eukprot:POR6336..scf295_1